MGSLPLDDEVRMNDTRSADVLTQARAVRRPWQLLAGLLMLVGLATLLVWSRDDEPVRRAATTSVIPTPALATGTGSCAGTVSLQSATGRQARVSVISPPAITVPVGDVLTIGSTGSCGSALWLAPQRDGAFVVESSDLLVTSLRAVAPRTVRVAVMHWACVERPAYDPGCRGLIALDGYVDIIVVAP